jgi:predicted DNA-binding protein with PD1-like motif
MLWREYDVQRVILWRLPHGADLFDSLTDFADKHDINSGAVFAIGAVSEAVVGFYDQDKKQYGDMKVEKPLEIVSCIGNITMRDGKPAVHAHIELADENGNTVGGHLMPGTRIFACEATVFRLDGKSLNRGHDDVTGLPLWNPGEG